MIEMKSEQKNDNNNKIIFNQFIYTHTHTHVSNVLYNKNKNFPIKSNRMTNETHGIPTSHSHDGYKFIENHTFYILYFIL